MNEQEPDVIMCPNGPMLLRGPHRIEDEAGNVYQTQRPFSAVCRCGKSAARPWCDGSHKLLRRTKAD